MSDREWASCEPFLPHPAWLAGKGGRPSRYCMRDVADAIRYLTHNGPVWRALPAVKAAEEVARSSRGYDAGKKINGGKRHIAVLPAGRLAECRFELPPTGPRPHFTAQLQRRRLRAGRTARRLAATEGTRPTLTQASRRAVPGGTMGW